MQGNKSTHYKLLRSKGKKSVHVKKEQNCLYRKPAFIDFTHSVFDIASILSKANSTKVSYIKELSKHNECDTCLKYREHNTYKTT